MVWRWGYCGGAEGSLELGIVDHELALDLAQCFPFVITEHDTSPWGVCRCWLVAAPVNQCGLEHDMWVARSGIWRGRAGVRPDGGVGEVARVGTAGGGPAGPTARPVGATF